MHEASVKFKQFPNRRLFMSKLILAIAIAVGLTFGGISFSASTELSKKAVACKDKEPTKEDKKHR
jgi:hypothetical protein